MSKAKPTLSKVASTLAPKKLGHRSLPKKHGLRKVVVLGAGASKSFGLPLATELLPDMIGWHRARGGDSSLKDIFEFLESASGGQTAAARFAEGWPATLAEQIDHGGQPGQGQEGVSRRNLGNVQVCVFMLQ